MSTTYSERKSTNPFVRAVWKVCVQSDAPYWVAADGCWDIIFARSPNGQTRIFASGPMSRARSVSHTAGTMLTGIRFQPGTFMNILPPQSMIDARVELGISSNGSFKLKGFTLRIPDFKNAEELVEELIKLDLLSHDPVVAKALKGTAGSDAKRTLQRHFAKAVGLPVTFISQVQRAQKAEQLLNTGEKAANAANLAGYSDHAHMIRSFKRITGKTPKQK